MSANEFELWDRRLRDLTKRQPVAMTFSDTAPSGIPLRPAPQPSGCSFWKLAADGGCFYTEANDHLGCTVGALTHGADIPEEKQEELSWVVGTMVKLAYLKEAEVPEIPRRSQPLRFVVYSPLGKTPLPPDIVIVRGNVRQLMVLTEAGRAAGHLQMAPLMGRPACAAVPLAMSSGDVVLSVGCIGNRVYTDLPDDEGYLAIPGSALASVMSQLDVMLEANKALEQFHQQRRAAMTEA